MFELTADWEALNEGSPEEVACFAQVRIAMNGVLLSEGHDPFVGRVRKASLLSSYPLAEWLAWNWWRLRWEPSRRGQGWRFAHAMATIGGGYVWPNLTIFPDGERVTVSARPSNSADDFAVRYINEYVGAVSAAEFEGGVWRFIEQVMGQLDAEGLPDTNLHRIWSDLELERRDGELSRYRRLEAMLGHDADEGPENLIRRLLDDEARIGVDGAQELAAEIAKGGPMLAAAQLIDLARQSGTPTDLRNAIRLNDRVATARGDTPAWLVGQRAAQAVRHQIGNDNEPLSNQRLAEMLAVSPEVLVPAGNAPMSFSFRDNPARANIVLRSRWETGRRFDLARLIGDVVASGHSGPLIPATRTATYRQKLQRSFAAELLSPFDAVEDMMQGDYSDEQQEEVAERFSVSPLTIRTMLVNHRKLEWDDFANDADLEAGIAYLPAAE
jgi:hypothetical protein